MSQFERQQQQKRAKLQQRNQQLLQQQIAKGRAKFQQQQQGKAGWQKKRRQPGWGQKIGQLAQMPNAYRKQKIMRFMNQKEKPTVQTMRKQHPNMFTVPKDVNYSPNFDNYRKLINQCYQLSSKQKLTPEQVFDKLSSKDPTYYALFSKLKQHVGSAKFIVKMNQFISGKVVKQVAQRLKVTLKDAMCILILDDYVDNHSRQHNEQLNDLFDCDTHGIMKDHAIRLIQPHCNGSESQNHSDQPKHNVPQNESQYLRKQGFQQITKFGGNLMSQDPYCSDYKYLKYLFNGGVAHPCPRFENHYMNQMTCRIQVPVVTLADGTAMLTIIPVAAMLNVAYAPNTNTLPFWSIAQGSSNYPFAALPVTALTPISQQAVNASSYAIDSVTIDYLHTQSLLNTKGKLTTSVFYQTPNNYWTKYGAGNNFVAGGIQITDTQLINNVGYVKRGNCADSLKLTRLATLIPQQNGNASWPIGGQNQNIPAWVNVAPMFVKFTGCTPAGQIGTAYITLSVSIQPVAAMRGILQVQPRGSYQGTFRILKQARKMGYPLEFMQGEQCQFLFKQHFGQVQFERGTRAVKFGQGKSVYPDVLQQMYSPKNNGFCVKQSLQFMGYPNAVGPWSTISQGTKYVDNYCMVSHGHIIYLDTIAKPSNLLLCFDLTNRHCTVVRPVVQLTPLAPYLTEYQQDFLYTYKVGNLGVQQWTAMNKLKQIAKFPINTQNLPTFLVRDIANNGLMYSPSLNAFTLQTSKIFDKTSITKQIVGVTGTVQLKQGMIWIVCHKTGQLTLTPQISCQSFSKFVGVVVDYDKACILSDISYLSPVVVSSSGYLQAIRLHTIQKNPGEYMRSITLRTVEKNPGPPKTANNTKKQTQDSSRAKNVAPDSYCMQCAIRCSLVMRQLQCGLQVTTSLSCDDCADDTVDG